MKHEFTACRVSGDGNAVFPDEIIIDDREEVLIYRKPRVIGCKESRVNFDAIGSVSIQKGVLFADIHVETRGGRDIIAKGFSRSDAERIVKLIKSRHQTNSKAGSRTAYAQDPIYAQQAQYLASQIPNNMPPLPNAEPELQYMVGLNGQPVGPFNWHQLRQMAQQGLLTHQTYVWKQGMANWKLAGLVQELQPLFVK